VASAQTKTRFTADDLAAAAKASTPAVPLSATGFLDLSKTKKKDAGASLTKDLLATELRARGEIVEVKGAKGEVKETKTELLGRLEKYVVDGKLARFSDLDGRAKSRAWAGSLTITIRPQEREAGTPPLHADAPPLRAETLAPPADRTPEPPPNPPPPSPPPKLPARAAGRKRAPPTVEPSPVKATATRSGRSSRRARHDDGT
jgi:hypothetical protein